MHLQVTTSASVLAWLAAAFMFSAEPDAAKSSPTQTGAPPLTESSLVGRGGDAQAFIPAGWKVTSQVTTDLNSDGRSDLAMMLVPDGFAADDSLLQRLDEEFSCSICESPPWHVALIVLCGTEPAGFERCGTNLAFTETNKSGLEIRTERAILLVSRSRGVGRTSSSKTWKFRWEPKQARLRLIGTEHRTDSVDSGSERSENWLTREALTRHCPDFECTEPWRRERLSGERWFEDPQGP